MPDFGTIVTPADVSLALEQHIRTWQRTALDIVATGRGFSRRLDSIRSYRHTNERPEKWDEDAVPCCVIVTGAGETSFEGDRFPLDFTVAVALVVGGRNAQNARLKASTYAAAIALLLNQRPGLTVGPQDAEATVAGWGGFDVAEQGATLAIGVCGYTIVVSDGLVLTGEWPEEPIPDPAPDEPPTYPDTPTAEEINVTVEQREG